MAVAILFSCSKWISAVHAIDTMNPFSMKIQWKCVGKPVMKPFLMAMKTEISDFMVFIRTIKFPSSFDWVVFMGHEKFTKHWKLISWATKSLSISDWKNSWPMKVQWPPSIYLKGHENYNWPWNSHVSNSWYRSQFPVLSHSVIPLSLPWLRLVLVRLLVLSLLLCDGRHPSDRQLLGLLMLP